MTTTTQRSAQIATPRTRAELDALVAQRTELRSQLRNADDRRTSLGAQAQVVAPEQRVAVTQRIAALDEQIQQLESRIGQLDRAITEAMANTELVRGEGGGGNAAPAMPAVPPVPPMIAFPEGDDAIAVVPPPFGPVALHPRMIVGGGLVTLSLMALVAWVTWRRAKARFGRRTTAVAAGEEVTRLQQSVDAIALEVERISENQRFLTKVLSEREPAREIAAREEPGRRST